MSEEETRDDIIYKTKNEVPAKEEIKEEVKEEIKEEEVKPKAKAKSKSRAKPNIKTVKESVEPVEPIVVEEKPVEPIVEKPVEETPAPVKVDELNQIVKCPDCDLFMTQHTLKYIHKRRGFCKAVVKSPEPEQSVPEPVAQPKTKITQDIVNDYIKENPDVVASYLRNERAMKAQRKQMHARSLLNNAFLIFYFMLLYIIKMPEASNSWYSSV